MAPATRPPVQLSAVTIRSDRSRASSTSRRARVTISSENIGGPLLTAHKVAGPEHLTDCSFKAIRADGSATMTTLALDAQRARPRAALFALTVFASAALVFLV